MKFSIASFVVLFAATTFANAGVVEYRILVNGEDVDVVDPAAAGTFAIDFQVQVTDNDIPGAGAGGLTSFQFNVPFADGLDAVETVFLGTPTGSFDAVVTPPLTLAGAFTGAQAGQPDFELFGVAGGFIPSTTNFQEIGAGVFTTILSGEFTFDGTPGATLELVPGESLVAVLNAAGTGIASAVADTIIGDSVVFGATAPPVIPEPASLALVGLGIAGVVARRRRV